MKSDADPYIGSAGAAELAGQTLWRTTLVGPVRVELQFLSGKPDGLRFYVARPTPAIRVWEAVRKATAELVPGLYLFEVESTVEEDGRILSGTMRVKR
jgi:hypothetical protein